MEAARRRHGNDVTTTTCLLLDSDYSQWPPWLDVLLGMYFTYCTMTTFTAHRSCVKKSYAIVLALMLFNAHVGPSNCCAASLGSLSHHAQDHSTPTAGRTHDSSIDREPRRLQAHGGQEGWLTSIQVVLMISSVVMISPVATMTTEVSPQPEHSNAIRILLIGAATIAVAVFVVLAANVIRRIMCGDGTCAAAVCASNNVTGLHTEDLLSSGGYGGVEVVKSISLGGIFGFMKGAQPAATQQLKGDETTVCIEPPPPPLPPTTITDRLTTEEKDETKNIEKNNGV
eukprot:GHVS01090430.1.p1 GENE.GHVS01090430.1~~GHVS01090430.1.p1  ORF type:complete len:285 (-),score=41.13 GHVS01090430.1:177-1031(-)